MINIISNVHKWKVENDNEFNDCLKNINPKTTLITKTIITIDDNNCRCAADYNVDQ